MKLLAFAASNHSNSINRALISDVSRRLVAKRPDVEVMTLDLNDYEMPIYSIDREIADGIHPLAQEFYDKISAADAILVSFAEYNGGVTSAWKNIFDWMSRINQNVWQGKPIVMLAASPGGRGGAAVLDAQTTQAPFFGADLRGHHGVGNWAEAWDSEANSLRNPVDIAAIDAAIDGLLS